MGAQRSPDKHKKKLKVAYDAKQRHWVGDGFYVHGLLRPNDQLNQLISPFVLMDYASPHNFPKTAARLGVGEHPHRGFETVTFAYQGEVQHQDSAGGGGVIKSGDVQWMTAGKGVVHSEFHSETFAKTGGIFEMVQLWVNLPKKHKMTPPKYQALASETFPQVPLNGDATLRVIAGEYGKHKGPASTFTPMNIYDLLSSKGGAYEFPLAHGSNTILLVMQGSATVGDQEYTEQTILIFDRDGGELAFEASKDFKGLILNGEPIEEPMVAYGPFVMNTKEEIVEAMKDYQNGEMGKLKP